MASNKKFDLDGFSVNENNVCAAKSFTSDTAEVSIFGGITSVLGLTVGSGSSKTIVDTTQLNTKSGIELKTEGDVVMLNLPTSDPTNAGQLWADSSAGYVLKVSQG
jgi:hypothetical protein